MTRTETSYPSDRNEMNMDEISQVAYELVQLYGQDIQKPFPYHGCRKVLRGDHEHMEGFIPDLALYFAEIAGFAHGAKRLNRWNEERIAQAQKMMERSFFEQHPEYRELEAAITPAETPDLYADMVLHELMRTKMLHLISLLMKRHSALHQSDDEGGTSPDDPMATGS